MENKLVLDILPKRQRELFSVLSKAGWLADYYLAGGTALALCYGHRRSIDFDFFTTKKIDRQLLKREVLGLGAFKLFAESEFILHGEIDHVQISFMSLPYPLIGEEARQGGLRIASVEDIAAMKLSAVSSRGSRKDFIDLYFLLKQYSLGEMIGFYEKKYGRSDENVYCVLKGLVYFDDAEKKPMPSMLKNVAWKDIRKAMISAHKAYVAGLK